MRWLQLSQDKKALVDDDDYERLSLFRWTASGPRSNGLWYAERSIMNPRRVLYMHREVLGLVIGDPDVDHINGDGLDNRRANLRLVTTRQNLANSRKHRTINPTSQYKGVSWDVSHGKWIVFSRAVPTRYVGLFDDEIEAALAYDSAARHGYGAHARTNFPKH